MSELIIYHGSTEIVQSPEFGKGKKYNDYGQGFYCTEHLELAKEWAVNDGIDGYANRYSIQTDGLKIMNLFSEEFTILHWLALLVQNRRIRTTSPIMRTGREWLIQNYLPDITGYDAIIGYRADDSYFSFARAFLDNTISVAQLSYAMRLGKLGEQFVLKSRNAFEAVRFDGYETVDSAVYYPKRKSRDEEARDAYQAELERDITEGLYIRDLIQGRVKPDDPRIR